jgi:hypothetical protein
MRIYEIMSSPSTFAITTPGTLHERLLGVHRSTKYYINPRYAEVMALLKPTGHDYGTTTYDGYHSKELRGYMIGGNLYVWNAYDEIHVHGRAYLHTEFGVGKDKYSGRPLVIRLKDDGTLGVMLGGIRRGYFIVIGPEQIDKFSRLKAATQPPQALMPPATNNENHHAPM